MFGDCRQHRAIRKAIQLRASVGVSAAGGDSANAACSGKRASDRKYGFTSSGSIRFRPPPSMAVTPWRRWLPSAPRRTHAGAIKAQDGRVRLGALKGRDMEMRNSWLRGAYEFSRKISLPFSSSLDSTVAPEAPVTS